MKAVILAGGRGTRLSEETHLRPKPMVEIGGRPILWHIMKGFAVHGVTEFVICLGYKGYLIKEYFVNLPLHTNDVSLDLASQTWTVASPDRQEPWQVHLVDTGQHTNTAGRVLLAKEWIQGDGEFFLTYGDGLTDANLTAETHFHRESGKRVTLLAVSPPSRYGALVLDGSDVVKFQEKPSAGEPRISGGFFVVNDSVIDEISSTGTSWEFDLLPELALSGQVNAFLHDGFWRPMDTLREKEDLEELWRENRAAWKTWT